MEIRVNKTTVLATVLMLLGVTLRLLPHTANFAPVGAIALFGGAVLGWRLALWLPLVIMVTSDLIIGLHPLVAFTWGGFMLISLAGMALRNQPNIVRVVAGATSSALIFFIISNFGVWLEGKLYSLNWQGLVECYAAAIPFLRMSFLADLFYNTVLFGLFALAAKITQGTIAFGRRRVLPS
jgi:hypothetical protein